MSLLLELNADLPDRFPNHERWLYIWTCGKKQCRRKPGTVRALRNVRATAASKQTATPATPVNGNSESRSEAKPNLGAQLFGGGGLGSSGGNPFASSRGSNPFSSGPAGANQAVANPFAQPASESAQSDLSSTFAQKARITDPSQDTLPHPAPREQPKEIPFEAWPTTPASPPLPFFHLDAEHEYLSSNPASQPSATQTAFLDTAEGGAAEDTGGVSAMPDDKGDRTFQHFADTLAQNPEQVLRYDFGGRPLLYRREDDIGRALYAHATGGAAPRVGTTASSTGMPHCPLCGARRVMELQMTPGAISAFEEELDATKVLAEGMEWGTIIVGVCENDCAAETGMSAREEWVGVQWEEVVDRRAPGKAGR